MQDSRRGLTRTEQRGRITFLIMPATFLLMQHRRWSAFWTASAHSRRGGVGWMVGVDDLRGLFQPMII